MVLYLFDLSSRHMTWLAERQSVAAANIANVDTPGYRAQATLPFGAVLDRSSASLTTTSPMHLSLGSGEWSLEGRQGGISWGSSHSGNTVSIESELMTASSNTRMMNLDSSVIRSFHRMFLSSVKV
jgi:flagellar basal-body rod protein FlgB